MERVFAGYLFTHICQIDPDCDETGAVAQLWPQSRYTKRDQYLLHAWGEGPFCRFRVPVVKKPERAGVYILTVDNQPVYVGKCKNLSSRFNSGYGQISPRNCYQGGQPTNCRINNLIYGVVTAGQRVDLWFMDADDRADIETSLIRALQTRQYWNRKD